MEVPEATDRLQVILAPYAWTPGLRGKVGMGGVSSNVDVSIAKIVGHLDGALMGQAEIRKGRLGLILEGFYSKMSADKSFRSASGDANLDVQMMSLSSFLAYRLVETRKASFDVMAGARYWNMKNTVSLSLPKNSFSYDGNASWIDPLVGARFGYDFNDQWTATVRGDVGGFGVGSNFTWQGFGGLIYKFTPRSAVTVGYRYLFADYESGGFIFNAGMGGPVAGLSFSF